MYARERDNDSGRRVTGTRARRIGAAGIALEKGARETPSSFKRAVSINLLSNCRAARDLATTRRDRAREINLAGYIT